MGPLRSVLLCTLNSPALARGFHARRQLGAEAPTWKQQIDPVSIQAARERIPAHKLSQRYDQVPSSTPSRTRAGVRRKPPCASRH